MSRVTSWMPLVTVTPSSCIDSANRSLAPISHAGVPHSKAYGSAWRIGRRHQLAESFEHHPELGVIFLFHLIELSGQFGVGSQQPTQAHKSAHDFNVHAHRPRTVQDAGQHGYALFGEGEHVAGVLDVRTDH